MRTAATTGTRVLDGDKRPWIVVHQTLQNFFDFFIIINLYNNQYYCQIILWNTYSIHSIYALHTVVRHHHEYIGYIPATYLVHIIWYRPGVR